MGGVREFDTFGAWLLERLTRAWSSSEQKGNRRDARARPQPACGDAWRQPRAGPGGSAWQPIVGALAAVGTGAAELGKNLLAFAEMLGAVGAATVRVLARPQDYRFTSTVNHSTASPGAPFPSSSSSPSDRRDHLAAGHFPFPQVRRRALFGRSRRHPRAARIGVLIVAIMVAGRSAVPTPPSSAR